MTTKQEAEDYLAQAKEAARETLVEFIDLVAEDARSGEVNYLYFANDHDEVDAYIREGCDEDYGLLEAAQLITQLEDYKETDRGLWEKMDPVAAVSVQAHYTFQNAVRGELGKLLKTLGNDYLTGEMDENRLECYARLFVTLGCDLSGLDDGDQSLQAAGARAALEDARLGSMTGVKMMLDYLTEHDIKQSARVELARALELYEWQSE